MANTGLKDLPITTIDEETLEIKPYIESLTQFVMECDTPMTIAIQGDWGSGKTSLMNLVKSSIEKQYPEKMLPIWFNTWQYSQFNGQERLGYSLLSRFAKEVSGSSEGMVSQAKKILGGLLKVTAKNAAFVGTMALTGSAEGARDAQDAIEGAIGRDPGDVIADLKSSLLKLTEDRLAVEKKDRIVVFIDDLDRLVPARAVELLEVFKLFLDVPGCVFVLACDYQVIAQGLREKFGIGENDLKGRSFFDKIIQLPFSMPVGQYDTHRYTSDLLKRIGINAHDDDLNKYQALISTSVGVNPRSMKRLFNSFQLINLAAEKKGLLEADGQKKTASRQELQRILLACLCLQSAFDPVYQYLMGRGNELSHNDISSLIEIDTAGDELSWLVESMGGPKSTMSQRLPDFMTAFYEALQLLSDNDDNLSSVEVDNLKRILRFSAITSTTASAQFDDGESRESQILKDSLIALAAELNDSYENELSTLNDTLRVSRGGSRKGKPKGSIECVSGLLFEKKRINFVCLFNARRNWAGVYLTTRQFDWLCQVIDKHIDGKTPYQTDEMVCRDEKCYYLAAHNFDDSASLEAKIETFRAMALESASLVIPKLAKARAR